MIVIEQCQNAILKQELKIDLQAGAIGRRRRRKSLRRKSAVKYSASAVRPQICNKR